MTIHSHIIDQCMLHARLNDRRIRHAPAAVRLARRDGVLMGYIRSAPSSQSNDSLDFRRDTYCSSGRSLTWFTPHFLVAGAMIRDLRGQGYSRDAARRIALSAVQDDRCIWAVSDEPPASVTVTDAAQYEEYGYMGPHADECAQRLGVSIDHVWRWYAWRRQARPIAQVGRRTRWWLDVVARDRVAAEAAQAERFRIWEAQHLAALSPTLHALQMTARCSCLIVSIDGQTITERLHDVGGTMTDRVGCNGYMLPDTLADRQAGHNRVYHPHRPDGGQ